MNSSETRTRWVVEDHSRGWKIFYGVVTFIGVLAITFSIIANVIQIIDIIKSKNIDVPVVMGIVARIMFICTAVLLSLALMRLSIMEDWFRFIVDWRGFGLTLLYLGVVSFAACADTPPMSDKQETARQAACWVTICIGIMYFVLGLCGGDRLKLRKTSPPLIESSSYPSRVDYSRVSTSHV